MCSCAQHGLATSEKPTNRDVDSFEGCYEGIADARSSPLGRVRHASASADAHGSEAADTYLQSSGDDAADQAEDEAGAFSAGLLVVPTGDSGALREAVIRVHTDSVLSDKVRMNGLGTAAPRTYGRIESIFLETLKAAKE